MKTGIIVVGALFAFAGACHGAGSFILASPEKTATVVLAKDCEPSSRLAAEELTNYVAKATGVALKVEVRTFPSFSVTELISSGAKLAESMASISGSPPSSNALISA